MRSLHTIHVFNNPVIDLLQHDLETNGTLSSLILGPSNLWMNTQLFDSQVSDFKWRKNAAGSITISFEMATECEEAQFNDGLLGIFLRKQLGVAASIGEDGLVNFRMEGVTDSVHITQIERGELATDALRLLLDQPTRRGTAYPPALDLMSAHVNDLDTLLEGNFCLIEQMDGNGFC